MRSPTVNTYSRKFLVNQFMINGEDSYISDNCHRPVIDDAITDFFFLLRLDTKTV